jgi:hypothetical protein
MKRVARTLTWIGALAALVCAGVANARETAPQVRPLSPDEPTQRTPRAAPPAAQRSAAVEMDPVMRALMIGIAASILREAAAQPDPVEALGNAVERRLAAAAANPNTMRLAEAALAQAFQDAPPELREPLALFATSVLHSMRRELLKELPPRSGY